MIKKLINLFKKQPKEPTYYAKDLYVGEIVLLDSKKDNGIITNYQYYPIKKNAILAREHSFDYLHLKSNQMLHTMHDAKIGDYALNHRNIYALNEAYHLRTIDKKVFAWDTKLTLSEIIKMEDELNIKKENTNETIFD